MFLFSFLFFQHQKQHSSPVLSCIFHMSRKQVEHDYNLRSMSNLMGERWKKVNDGGERSLIKAPSSASISSQGASAGASTAGASAAAPASTSSTGDLERAARKQFQQDVTPGFVYVLAAFSALGGFLFGYDTGVISGAMLLLKRELDLSALWQEVLISSTVAAAALSALLGGFLNGLFGRRVCILLASFFFTVGGIVLSTAPGKEVLLTGRVIVGVGLGKTRSTRSLSHSESCKLPKVCLTFLFLNCVLNSIFIFFTFNQSCSSL